MSPQSAVDPAGGRPVVPTSGRLRPLGLSEVRITGGFWEKRQRTNADASLGHIYHWLEREGWTGNFDPERDGDGSARPGREFSDSEVYKFLEAAAWEVARTGDAELEARLTELVERIAEAQDSDGYLNTAFGHVGQPKRYSDLEWGHELYCYGHLLQAAVARARTHGEDKLFEVARRVADHVCATFGPDGVNGVCGHPEIETALVEFSRLTGEQRYLDQAALFVERRGRGLLADIEYGRSYYQDDEPVRESSVLRGHAVRALYLAAGAVDLAVETNDDDLLQAVAAQWDATVARRTYLTGGMGSHHQDESFGDDFVLPPDRAYSETCAGVASVMLSWRLLLATGEPKYADLIERTLFNVVAASPALDGRSFFYANTLHQRRPGVVPDPDSVSPRASSSLRAPWFEVSCCPPNVARTLASLAGYLVTADEDGVQLHQYADMEIRTNLPDGRRVALDVTTAYPYEGDVVVRVMDAEPRPMTVSLRIPAWAQGAEITVGGECRRADPGLVAITETFARGDEIRLHLPVTARFTSPDPRIDAVRHCVAVERGPLVLCAESIDGSAPLDELIVDASGGVDDLRASLDAEPAPVARIHAWRPDIADHPWPYRSGEWDSSESGGAVDVALIPYYTRANRGPSTMRVWLPMTR